MLRIVLTRRENLDSPDGVSIFVVSLAQAFIELGHTVKVVAGLHSRARFERLLAPRLDIPIVPLGRMPSVFAWLRAKRLIDRFHPHLVIHNEAMPSRCLASSCRLLTTSSGGRASWLLC